jgi:hypothetical protein
MASPRHDWFLKDWLKTLGKKQEHLTTELGWNKSKASLTVRGIQPYDRDDVNEAAAYLNIQPFELLMHPDDAFTIRRLLVEAKKMTQLGERLHVIANRTGTEG